ncbi:MAG: 30S ribosomal protein S6 [Verrucomicrobiae bacterium]|nr:30S ribosomal protein S6 [Verrucomicrobiae bacterium]
MTLTKRTYKTTFILDTRDQQKTVEEIISEIKNTLETMDVSVTKEDDLGRRDFVRVTDRRFTGGHYYEMTVDAPVSFARDVKEKFRLDKVVYRIIVQS